MSEISQTGFFARLGSSFAGMGAGIVLLLAGTILLWQNEGSFVRTEEALLEVQAEITELKDLQTVDPAMNGIPVHASGFANTEDMLTDPAFGLSVKALSLHRIVEYYQWVEVRHERTEKTASGGEKKVASWSYEQKWTGDPVDSSLFSDPDARRYNRNFQLIRVDPQKTFADDVHLGAYRLPDFLIQDLSGERPVAVQIPDKAREKIVRIIDASNPDRAYVDSRRGDEPEADLMLHEFGEAIYVGLSPAMPQIGDVRITFHAVPPSDISIIARVIGNTFESIPAANGAMISRLSMGIRSAEAMFAEAHEGNLVRTWMFRAGGAALVVFGLKLLIGPLTVLIGVVPLLGTIVNAGIGLCCALLGSAWSLIVAALAWLRFRPLVGGSLLGAALLCLFLLVIRSNMKKASAAAVPASDRREPPAE
ncbi:MAG: TMEM43 family protein [Desulfovibrionaceae bacterium]|nr:TMEM43 family protein [Desulfovibrionaceae bacterium]